MRVRKRPCQAAGNVFAASLGREILVDQMVESDGIVCAEFAVQPVCGKVRLSEIMKYQIGYCFEEFFLINS